MGRILLVLLLLFSGPVGAQSGDVGQMQRCIWSCLSNSPGAASYQYNQCVETFCSSMRTPVQTPQRAPVQAPVQIQPPVRAITPGGWNGGVATNGTSYFAGIYHPSGDGRGLFYICNRQRESYVALIGVDTPEGIVQFVFSDLQYQIPFDRKRGDLSADLAPVSQFMRNLSGTGTVRIADVRGNVLMDLGLHGAGAAIRWAASACAS